MSSTLVIFISKKAELPPPAPNGQVATLCIGMCYVQSKHLIVEAVNRGTAAEGKELTCCVLPYTHKVSAHNRFVECLWSESVVCLGELGTQN